MDLQAALSLEGKRWSCTKVAAILCFVAAGCLLIGSLASPSRAVGHAPVLSIR